MKERMGTDELGWRRVAQGWAPATLCKAFTEMPGQWAEDSRSIKAMRTDYKLM